MGKPTGFIDYERQECHMLPPEERLKNWNEFKPLLSRKEQEQQAARCMDCGVPFCQAGMMFGNAVSGCPLHNLIPEWNDLLYEGNWQQAYYRLRVTNNFPEFTGRVCPSPCEKACSCNLTGEPVTTHNNELSIIENAWNKGWVRPRVPKVRTGKNIAIVGSGPSGLAAADQLNRRGHNVTVYERFDRPGGLLMYGIPNMKLDKQVVKRRTQLMEQEGVKFVTGADVGNNVDAQQLIAENDAVILCCGASNPRDLTAPGRDAKGIYFAVEFLRANTKSLLDSNHTDENYINVKGKKVLVVGGGDTGNDCVGTCIRQGAASVIQFEMMGKPPAERLPSNPWPQWPNVLKTDYGQEEAIWLNSGLGAGKARADTAGMKTEWIPLSQLAPETSHAEPGQLDPRIYNTTVEEFHKNEKGELCGVTAVNLSWEGGKMTKLDTWYMDVDVVLIAAGFLGCQSYVADAFGVKQTPRTCVDTVGDTRLTSVDKVFAAGDMRRGQSLVVWGIREGREVAYQVDKYLMGYTNLEPVE